MSDLVTQSGGAVQSNGVSAGTAGGRQTTNLGDILERVLDKGLVIAGDIRINLLDIELLTVKLRLVIASVDTAKEMGIDWWEADPWFSAKGARQEERQQELEDENRELRSRLAALEPGDGHRQGEGD